MRVLLIHLPYYRGSEWSLPIGLAYIAAVLRKTGVEVDVCDINLLTVKKEYSPDRLYRELKKDKYDLIGFGAVFFDFSFFQKLSGEIKKICPDTFQVIGGQWASRIPDLLVDNTSVDAVLMGEGEEVILQIADCLQKGEPIAKLQYVHVKSKPLVYEFATIRDLDTVPFPARDLFDMNLHRLERWDPDPLRYFSTMIATRGCGRKCIFCSPLGGKILRSRSPENIVQEMKELNDRYKIKYFRFNDEVFLGVNKKVLAFCDVLESSKLNITFSIWSWSENLSEEAICRLKDVGCNRIQVGIESGSPQILKEMNKVQNLARVKEKVRFISDQGLLSGSGFLTGTPGETKETLQQTKNFIKELHAIPNFTITKIDFIKLFRGSGLYSLAKERGLIGDDLKFLDEADKNQMYKLINLTKFNEVEYFDMINKINNELKWNYYSTHKIRLVKRLLLVTGIDFKNLFKKLSLEDIPPITQKMKLFFKHHFYVSIFKLKFLRRIIDFKTLGYTVKSKEEIFHENT